MKKMLKVAALGASVLALAATANAADYNLNIFGASAQGKFWNAAAPAFLENTYGCTVVQYGDADSGIAVGTGCTVAGESDKSIDVRYTAFASIWGIKAVKGLEDVDTSDSCPAGEAMMMKEDGSGEECTDVNIGASDVSGEAFSQASNGYELGPMSDYNNEDPLDISLSPEDTSMLSSVRPVIVPFSFFATNDLGLSNITPLQAKLLFSGQVNYWETLGIDKGVSGVADTKVTLCMRHAGSGTHATLDHAVLHKDAALVTAEDYDGTNGAITWFNRESSDLARCMSYDGSDGFNDPTAYAVGYLDSDKCGSGSGPYVGGKCDGLVRLTYAGAEGNRDNITTGAYDFWASQWLYYSETEMENLGMITAGGLNMVEDLYDFASDHNNLETYLASKADFWATDDVMKVTKATDFVIPSVK